MISRYFISFLCMLAGLSSLSAQQDAIVLFDNTRYVISNKGLTEEVEIAIQINNKEGLYMAEVSIPYTSQDNLSNIKAHVEDEAGNMLLNLKKKDIVDASSISGISLYEDNRVKRFSLSNPTFPFIVRYSYKRESKEYLQICDWSPVIAYDVSVKEAKLVFEYPNNFNYKVSKILVEDGTTTYGTGMNTTTWRARYNAENWESENLSIPNGQSIPRVEIIPENFTYGLPGSFESWSSYGLWLESLSTGLHDLPGWQKQKVKELIADKETKEEQVKALYYFMQDNTRYINVSIDIGGMKPYPASYVAVNKYGDCKALTNYMQALLKEAGIESYCVDVQAGSKPEVLFDPDVPRQAFNHVILAVPMEKDTIWLENTDNTSPFGYLGTFTQNRKALWVDGANTKLVDIPGLAAEEVSTDHKISIDVKSQESISATVMSTFRGKTFERISYLAEQDEDVKLSKTVNQNLPYPRAGYEQYRMLNRDRDDKEVNFMVNMDLKNYTRSFGDTKALFLPKVLLPSLERPTQRKTPLLLPSPIRQDDEITVTSENGVALLFEVEDLKLESPYGHYELSSENTEEGVKIKRTFNLKAGKYSLEEYEAFYQFLQKIKKEERKAYLKLKST